MAITETERTLVPYTLPDGRIVWVDASAVKDARIIDYTMADGSIVIAIQHRPLTDAGLDY